MYKGLALFGGIEEPPGTSSIKASPKKGQALVIVDYMY